MNENIKCGYSFRKDFFLFPIHCVFLEFSIFEPRVSGFSVGKQKRHATSSHVIISDINYRQPLCFYFVYKNHSCLEYDLRFVSSKPRVTCVQVKGSS